jgi:Integral peroxisomal membrane peroxin
MLAYERASWTDEHLNPAPSKDRFELPHVESGTTRWRWVEGSTWKIEGGSTNSTSPAKSSSKGTKSDASTSSNDGCGWIYCDNKWNDGKRDADSWGKYTRRRKWYRDAELVEVTPSTEVTPSATPNEAAALSEAEIDEKKKSSSPKKDPTHRKTPSSVSASLHPSASDVVPFENDAEADSASSKASKRRGWFSGSGGKHGERRDSKSSSILEKRSLDSALSARTDPEDDHVDQWKSRENEGARSYGLGEDAIMGLS